MGTVFEAEDEVLGRRVAIKRLKAVDESARARFWREARAVARLSHPNVCQLYEVGEDESGPFLAMELLRGEPLSARLKRKPMTAEEVLPLGAGMLAALHVIHAAGLVHRDLKPSNVYLTPYGPRLLDFGLVRQVSAELADLLPSQMITPGPAISRTPITDADHLIGTPRYMAPEQILGHPVDGRADLFAVGVVLYEALAGRPAFSGTLVVEVLSATLQESPPPLPPPLARLDAVLQRALAKEPSDRFATAQEMAEALHAAAAAPAARADRPAQAARRGHGRDLRGARGRARLAPGAPGRGTQRRRRRRVRDRRARRRQNRAGGRSAAPGAFGAHSRHRRRRPLHGTPRAGRSAPALPRRVRPPLRQPRARAGSGAGEDLGPDGRRPDADGAGTRPGRLAPPPERRSDARATDPRGEATSWPPRRSSTRSCCCSRTSNGPTRRASTCSATSVAAPHASGC